MIINTIEIVIVTEIRIFLVLNTFWVKKNFWVKFFLGENIIVSEIDFRHQKLLALKINFAPQKFYSKTNLGPKRFVQKM